MLHHELFIRVTGRLKLVWTEHGHLVGGTGWAAVVPVALNRFEEALAVVGVGAD